VQTLLSDTLLAAQYRLDGVVTLVDAVNGLGQIAQQPEAEKQIALADRVLVTKSDLASDDDIVRLRERIVAINEQASIRSVVMGEIDPIELTGLGLASARAGAATLRFLGEGINATADATERYLGDRVKARHDSRVGTLSLRFDKPFTWQGFTAAMELLTSMRGPDLLRVKGIVNVDGAPVVVQCVQHIFHPPVPLDAWPSADTGTRLVFITRNISAEAIRGLFTAVGAVIAS
jgi:G3E family GTPase